MSRSGTSTPVATAGFIQPVGTEDLLCIPCQASIQAHDWSAHLAGQRHNDALQGRLRSQPRKDKPASPIVQLLSEDDQYGVSVNFVDGIDYGFVELVSLAVSSSLTRALMITSSSGAYLKGVRIVSGNKGRK